MYQFPYTLEGGLACAMTFTSVSGHLKELDFTPEYKNWRACSPVELYAAPVGKVVPQVSCVLPQGNNYSQSFPAEVGKRNSCRTSCFCSKICSNKPVHMTGWCSGWTATGKGRT